MDLMPAKNLALSLMEKHGLKEWKFDFMSGRRTLGLCHYGKKTIFLSWIYAKETTEENVKDTILHEIAHALAGHKAGHGYLWQIKCIEIGARPKACKDISDMEGLKGDIKGVCMDCKKEFHRHNVTKLVKTNKLRCPSCLRNRATYGGVISWSKNGTVLN